MESLESNDENERNHVLYETKASFDLVLEMISSLYVLEPFDSSQVCDYIRVILSGLACPGGNVIVSELISYRIRVSSQSNAVLTVYVDASSP